MPPLEPPSDVRSPVQEIDCEEYNMGHPRRGIAIILNHVTFETKEGVREGSEMDCEKLQDMLNNLGFEVRVHIDLTYVQVLTVLKDGA
jgi:hypothetical protein